MQQLQDISSLINHLRANPDTVEIFATSKAKTADKSKVQNFIKDRTQLVLIGVKS